MAWKSNKKALDLEKAIGADTISSFGSVKHNVIVLPPPAHSKGSYQEGKFEHSGNSSPQFTSSFPTSEERERRMKSFIRRHAFVIIVAMLLTIAACIVTFIVLLRGRDKFIQPSNDQITPTLATPSVVPFPTTTAD